MLYRTPLYNILLPLLAAAPFGATANEVTDLGTSQSNCWVEAGTYYSVDPWLLYSIAEKESSLNPSAINRTNKDGSYDIGLMQINSSFLPYLKEYGITEAMLYDPCTNIKVGAWVLRQGMSVFGNNWRAVGAYNAGTRKNDKTENLREKYATDVHSRYHDNLRRLQQLAASDSPGRAGSETATSD